MSPLVVARVLAPAKAPFVRTVVGRAPHVTQRALGSSSSPGLLRVISPSFLQTLLPKFIRRRPVDKQGSNRSAQWNPATYFVVMALLVGSNAIQIIALKRYMLNYSRRTEAKLAVLREVVSRVQRGEDVDVEAMLGTGQPDQEREWEQVMKEVEAGNNNLLRHKAKGRRSDNLHVADDALPTGSSPSLDRSQQSPSDKRPGFY